MVIDDHFHPIAVKIILCKYSLYSHLCMIWLFVVVIAVAVIVVVGGRVVVVYNSCITPI